MKDENHSIDDLIFTIDDADNRGEKKSHFEGLRACQVAAFLKLGYSVRRYFNSMGGSLDEYHEVRW